MMEMQHSKDKGSRRKEFNFIIRKNLESSKRLFLLELNSELVEFYAIYLMFL